MNLVPERDWNAYWRDSAGKVGLYAAIAKVYRRFIIAPALRYYFHRYFADTPDSLYLHAGCGSGESDNQIAFRQAHFVLLDKSPEALSLARQKTRLANVHLVCGDVFRLPFRRGVFAGVWNLGVMEHFAESDIDRTLVAIRSSLREDGRCLLFWPPRWGLSVMVLTSFLYVANLFRRNPLVLYPDELSRLRSRQWVSRLLATAGLRLTAVHFGAKDAFTYAVVVAEKSPDALPPPREVAPTSPGGNP